MTRTLMLTLAAGLLVLVGCSAVSQMATQVAVDQGAITEDQATSINRTVVAVEKAYTDITPEQEYYIGRAVAATLLVTYKPLDDAVANGYLNQLGQTLAMASARPETFGGYHFLLLDSDEINAFACPGGLVLVSRGLVACCRNEDELAAVLAHEIGHVAGKHGLRSIKKSRLTGALTILAAEGARNLGSADVAALVSDLEGSIDDITQSLVNSGYSRGLEQEADAAALDITAAGSATTPAASPACSRRCSAAGRPGARASCARTRRPPPAWPTCRAASPAAAARRARRAPGPVRGGPGPADPGGHVSDERQSRRRFAGAAAIGLVAAAVGLGLGLAGSLDRAENVTWDWRVQRTARASSAADAIALVLVDQASLDWGRKVNAWPWPWPREVYTAVVAFCRRAGARTVSFDVLFTEPSLFGVDDDQTLADDAGRRTGRGGGLLRRPGGRRHLAGARDPGGRHPAGQRGRTARPRRRDPPRRPRDRGRRHPAEQPGPGHLRAGRGGLVPQSTQARIPAYAPAGTYATYNAAEVIQSELRLQEGEQASLAPDALRGKHVFVGFSAPGLLDLRSTPLSRVSPGVVVHATVLDNLLTGGFIRPAATVPVVLATLLLSVLGALLAVRTTRLLWQAVLFVVGVPLPLGLGVAMYGFGVWWPVVSTTLGIGLALVGGLALNWATEGRQRRFLKQAFRHYLSPHVIDRLVDDPNRLQLGGERRTLSIFFSDLAGFTGLGERLDPEALTALLNAYLSAMTDIILQEGGTLDKYEGDAIIAFWNAPLDQPDHALRAARAAVRCQQELESRQGEWQHLAGSGLSMRIGVHTGPVVVGNLGSRQRFDYTVLGDAANLASRLEGANKVFGTGLMVSEATVDAGAGVLPHRELGRVQVVGRREPVTVFELFTGLGSDPPASWQAYREGLELVRAGQIAPAFRLLEPHVEQDPAAMALARKLTADPEFRGLWRLDAK
ncbi:MAG: CHASE2 domain-containing protein [Candidatus Krumholzibacteriia bacterium]